MIDTKDVADRDTVISIPVALPGVSGYMQAGYDLKLAAILAELCNPLTVQDLIARCIAEQEVERG